jgi:hypothetical protein
MSISRESTPEQFRRRKEIYPGPRAAVYLTDAVRYWRTPTASAGGTSMAEVEKIASGDWTRPSGQRRQMRLQDQIMDRRLWPDVEESLTNLPEGSTPIGKLNPTWVEWLMGFPIGWTELSASGTPSSPRSPGTSGNESSNTRGLQSMTNFEGKNETKNQGDSSLFDIQMKGE